jgi:4-hydroxy-3-methylbut-2-enyl diphosphate reductase
MKIKIAKYSGFCFGVKRAIDMILDTSKKNSGKNICMFGPVVNNKFVLDNLKKQNIFIEKNLNNISKNNILAIRAHGIGPSIYKKIKSLELNFVDCTCPYVKKIHSIVEKNFKSKNKIIITGDKNHPEVIGINDHANDSCFVIKNLSETINFVNKINNIYIKNKYFIENFICVSQTTFDNLEFKKIKKILENSLNVKVYNTICDTTYKRQFEADDLSKKCDKILVIGDQISSNTIKLFNICKKNNNNTFFIEVIKDLNKIKFRKSDSVCLIAGASVPYELIKMIELELKKIY